MVGCALAGGVDYKYHSSRAPSPPRPGSHGMAPTACCMRSGSTAPTVSPRSRSDPVSKTPFPVTITLMCNSTVVHSSAGPVPSRCSRHPARARHRALPEPRVLPYRRSWADSVSGLRLEEEGVTCAHPQPHAPALPPQLPPRALRHRLGCLPREPCAPAGVGRCRCPEAAGSSSSCCSR